MRYSKVILISLCLFSGLSAFSQDSHSEPNQFLTLEDYLRTAAMNNAELRASFDGWKAALEQIPQAGALDDPRFTYSYFIDQVETRVGPMNSKVTLMQTFPWFGKLAAKTDAASAAAAAAQQKYEAVKLNLFNRVKKNYFEYSYLSTAIHIAQDNLQLLAHFEEVARTKYKTTAASHPDVVRAQIELAKLEDVLTSLRELQRPAAARLNALLNRPAEASLPWPEKIPLSQVTLDRSDVLQTLIQSNPELAALDWDIETAKSRIELAQKKFYPDIGVGVDWTQIGPAANPALADSGKDAVALMFSINIPLWRDSYKAAERQARADLRKVRHTKTEQQNQKIAAAYETLYDIEDSQRKIRLYGETLLSKAEELLATSETAYQAGNVDFLSLVDAQRMLLGYQLNYERAVTNYQQKIAELEMLMGKELVPMNPDKQETPGDRP